MAINDFLDPSLIGGEDPRWRTQPYRPSAPPSVINTVVGSTSPSIPPSSYGSSAMDQMMRLYEQQRRSQGFSDVSSIFGGLAEGARADRQGQGNKELDFDRMMLEREAEQNRLNLLAGQDRRTSEADAFKKLGSTGFILSGAESQFKPPQVSIRGQMLNLPMANLPAPTEGEMTGARTLQDQMLERLQPGTGWQPSFNYTPRPLDERSQGPSAMERIGNYGALATGGLGVLDMLTGGKGTQTIGSGIKKAGGAIRGLQGLGGGGGALPTSANYTNMGINAGMGSGATGTAASAGSRLGSFVGNYAPYAAAIPLAMGTGGRWGSAGSGAILGAKIGSSFGPIGTGVGAGIGAVGGFLRGMFGEKKTEKEGREAASQARQELGARATPAQIAEARMAGTAAGGNQNAISHIVLRDQFGEERASQIMRQLFEAEKGGKTAVQQAYGAIR